MLADEVHVAEGRSDVGVPHRLLYKGRRLTLRQPRCHAPVAEVVLFELTRELCAACRRLERVVEGLDAIPGFVVASVASMVENPR